jgi:hypothetical protein
MAGGFRNVRRAALATWLALPLALSQPSPARASATSAAARRDVPANRLTYAPAPAAGDTALQASARLDLSAGPVVLHVPAIRDRAYRVRLVDGWAHVVAAPGGDTLGGAARDFAIVGPGFAGALPAGLQRIDAPADAVWLLGRTEVKGSSDLPLARAGGAIQRRAAGGAATWHAASDRCRPRRRRCGRRRGHARGAAARDPAGGPGRRAHCRRRGDAAALAARRRAVATASASPSSTARPAASASRCSRRSGRSVARACRRRR